MNGVRSKCFAAVLLASNPMGCKRDEAPKPQAQPSSVSSLSVASEAAAAIESATAKLRAATLRSAGATPSAPAVLSAPAFPNALTTPSAAAPPIGNPLAGAPGFPFTVMESAKLRPVTQVTQALILTPEGQIPTRSPLDPMFIVAPSLGFSVIVDKKAFAMKRLHEMPGIAQVMVTQDDRISIDGLDGFEAVANGRESRTGATMVLYQVTLFERDSHVLLNGMVGSERASEYLPEFKALARSLQRKRP